MIDLDAIKAEIARTRLLVAEIERLNTVLRQAHFGAVRSA